MALATLGLFVFHMNTIPFQNISRSQTWKHPHQNVVGSMPPSQFTGKDPDEINIKAELRPEITGGENTVEFVRQMADTGQAHPLIMGTGKLMGSFVITNIQEDQSELMWDGKPRSISFTMTLKKSIRPRIRCGRRSIGFSCGHGTRTRRGMIWLLI